MIKYIFILTLITSVVFSQEKPIDTIYNYEKVVKELNDAKNIKSYIIDKSDIDSLVILSKKKHHILYSFANWCAPCVKSLPKVIDFVEKNKGKRIQSLINYLSDNFKYNKPIFSISEKYSSKKNKKYDKFIQEIIPNHSEYGLSLLILIDEQNVVKYASTYNETTEDSLSKVYDIIVN